jgi:hypothetical protein
MTYSDKRQQRACFCFVDEARFLLGISCGPWYALCTSAIGEPPCNKHARLCGSDRLSRDPLTPILGSKKPLFVYFGSTRRG